MGLFVVFSCNNVKAESKEWCNLMNKNCQVLGNLMKHRLDDMIAQQEM